MATSLTVLALFSVLSVLLILTILTVNAYFLAVFYRRLQKFEVFAANTSLYAAKLNDFHKETTTNQLKTDKHIKMLAQNSKDQAEMINHIAEVVDAHTLALVPDKDIAHA
jgi:D-alanyl-lipoteichoic acid acyltransferase DltB (MBOAT superfamily)